MTNNMYKNALYYREFGYSVIPILKGSKNPPIKWKEFQSRIATEDEIKRWWDKWPDANIAVVTGAISGVVVVDVDVGGSTTNLPPTAIAKTGSGGWHFYYKHPGVPVKNAVCIEPKIDVRGDGGYALLPPSLHKSGNRYEWTVDPKSVELVDLPDRFATKQDVWDEQIKDWTIILKKCIKEHEGRNQQATSVGGYIIHHLPQNLFDLGFGLLEVWNNKQCDPPLDDKELGTVWGSVINMELTTRKKKKEEDFNSEEDDKIIKKMYGL